MMAPPPPTATIGVETSAADAERNALAGMLQGYSADQLVDEVISAWEDLATANKELVEARQRARVLELDLADRADLGAPQKAKLERLEDELRSNEQELIHLKRLLEQVETEKEELLSSSSSIHIDELGRENRNLTGFNEEQAQVIVELESKLDQLMEALERAAEAGLTSVTADEVRNLNQDVDDLQRQLETEKTEIGVLEDERDQLREIVEQVRGMLNQRDERIKEMEGQLQRIMEGPRSISAEHDYLIEQIEELKRRLLERNREYEALRRRERRLHREVFERDERIQQMQLTMEDIEGGLNDRTSELKALEAEYERSVAQLDSLKSSERKREVVGKAFADSLGVLQAHSQLQVRRTARGETGEEEEDIPADPESPGGTAAPVLRDVDDLNE